MAVLGFEIREGLALARQVFYHLSDASLSFSPNLANFLKLGIIVS
jgi:hypothetical protein